MYILFNLSSQSWELEVLGTCPCIFQKSFLVSCRLQRLIPTTKRPNGHDAYGRMDRKTCPYNTQTPMAQVTYRR